jgi:hypothetical protein
MLVTGGVEVESEAREVIVNVRLSKRELAKLQRLERVTRRSRANLLRWLITSAQYSGPDVVIGKGGQDDAKTD